MRGHRDQALGMVSDHGNDFVSGFAFLQQIGNRFDPLFLQGRHLGFEVGPRFSADVVHHLCYIGRINPAAAYERAEGIAIDTQQKYLTAKLLSGFRYRRQDLLCHG